MTIRNKLIAGYLLLALFLGVQAGVSFYFNDQAKALADEAIEKNFEASLQLSAVTVRAEQMRRFEKEMFIYVTQDREREKYRKEWEAAFTGVTDNLAAMIANPKRIFSQQDIAAMQRWEDGLSRYGWEFRRVAQRVTVPGQLTQSPEVTANAMIQAGKEQVKPLLAEAPAMIKAKRAHAQVLVAEIGENYELAEVIFSILTVLGILVTGVIVFVLPGQVGTSLDTLIGQSERLSLGTLDGQVDLTTVPEFDRLAKALRRIQTTQGALVERIQRLGSVEIKSRNR